MSLFLAWLARLFREWKIGGYPAIAILAALSVGAAIPPQGAALRALSGELGSPLLAAGTSLFGGSIVFGVTVLCKRNSGIISLFRWKTWYYMLSGAPGAEFIAVYSLAARESSLFMASLAAVVGQVLFTLIWWRKLGWIQRLLAVASVLLVIAAALNGGTVETPSGLGALWLLLTAITGFGVSWQFMVLGKMAKKSVRAAAAVSSISGFFTAIATHCLFAALGWWPLLPSDGWPTAPDDLWMYSCSVAGIWIILAGTYASKVLDKIYAIVMVSGNLLCGLAIGWAAMSVVLLSKVLIQLVSALLAILGVVLRVFSGMIEQFLIKLFKGMIEHIQSTVFTKLFRLRAK